LPTHAFINAKMISNFVLASGLDSGGYSQKSPVGITDKFFPDFVIDFAGH
jgi:hypothetical protein